MASINPYKKGGQSLYRATVYLGRDELTNRPRYKKRSGFRTKKAAAQWASIQTLDVENATVSSNKNPRFEVVYQQWFESYKNTVRPTTWMLIKAMFDNHILPALGDAIVSRISTSVLQKTVNQWASEGGVNYRVWYGRAVAVIRYAMRQRLIKYDPSNGVILPKRPTPAGDAPVNAWTREELLSFLALVDPVKQQRWYTMCVLLAFSGLRRGELLAMTWDDVNFTEGTIRVNKTQSRGVNSRPIVQAPKTPASRRTIPLDSGTLDTLHRWRVDQSRVLLMKGINATQPGQLLFPSSSNEMLLPSSIDNWFSRFQRDHHFPHYITVHGLRHTHASLLLAAGANVKEVQQRLGHENAQTTLNVYTHISTTQSVQAARKLEEYMAAPPEQDHGHVGGGW